MPTQTPSNSRDLSLFFLITFAYTWLLQLPRLMAAVGWFSLSPGISTLLGNFALLGPALAAFLLTGLRAGKAGMWVLWRRGWELRARKTWLVPALLLMPASSFLTLGVLTALGISLPKEYFLSLAMLVPVGLMIWLLGALPEEFGWRGYALDRLQNGVGPLRASLVLGLIWSLWHLPLHFIPGTTQAAIPVWEFAAQTIVLTCLYTWLHNRTSGSILIAGLFHASGNLSGALMPTWTVSLGRWLGLLPLLVMAVIVILAGGLRRDEPDLTRSVHPTG